MESPKSLSSGALTECLYTLRRQERTLLVAFLSHLGEMDRRRLYLELGFSTLFAFCRARLGMSKSSSYRRIASARLMAQFPVIAAYLADGRLNVTALYELRDVLIEERLSEVLDRASGRSLQEVQALIASYLPRPATTARIERSEEGAGSTGEPTDPAMKAIGPGRIEAISEELQVLRLTVGKAFMTDLEQVRALLSQEVPDGNLEKILHQCLRTTIAEYRRRQLRPKGTPKASAKPPQDRAAPAETKSAVRQRDERLERGMASEDVSAKTSTPKPKPNPIVPSGRRASRRRPPEAAAPARVRPADPGSGTEHKARVASSE